MPQDGLDDITLDNVLNTGEDSGRTNNPPADAPTAEELAAIEAAKNDAPAGTDSSTDDESDADNASNLRTLFSSFADSSDLDEDNTAIREQLLAEHKGTSFDVHGNILDAQGNVVASFEDLLAFSTAEEKVTLDDKGNQVDTKGNVVKTAIEIAVETTVVNKLHSESDYEFLNEDGSTKIYSDDEKGIKDFTNDVSAQRFEEWKSEFFSQTPELAEITKHILSGGTIDTYNSTTDYSKLDTTTMSKDDKLKYIRRSFEITGLSEERINGLVQLFVDSNTVDSEVARALPALQANEEKTKGQRDIAYQQSMADRNAKVEEYWNNVEKTVVKGTLADISIPETEKAAFFDYLSSAVDDKGNSKEMLDAKKETLEQQLQVKYLRFKGYDLSKLVNSKVGTQKVATLKDLIKRSAKLKDTPVNDARKGITSRETNITIDSLLG